MDKQVYEIKPCLDFTITEISLMTEQEAGKIGESYKQRCQRSGTDPAIGAEINCVHPVISFEGTDISIGTKISWPCCFADWSVYAEGKAIYKGNIWFSSSYDRAELEETLKKDIRTMAERCGISVR